MTDDLETICSIRNFGSTKFVQMMTLDLSYSKVKFSHFGFCVGKKANSGFFWSYCSLWHQSWYLQSAKGFFYKYQRSRSFIDFCPGCLTFSIFIFFSSKTVWLIETKLNAEPLLDKGMKVCSWDLGHMIKMATIPIHGKHLWKSSSHEPNGWWLWNFICTIGNLGSTKFVQIVTLAWPGPILRQGQIWSLGLLYGKKAKLWIYVKLLYPRRSKLIYAIT